ncbi:MAG: Na(+)-translocating NADH-quinone reductase subunit C [Saccharospirillum sp.]
MSSKNKDSIQNVIKVALMVCLACAIVVSSAAVALRPVQERNQELDFRRNILNAAGLLEAGRSVEEQFEQIEVRLVDLTTGQFTDAMDPADFDPRRASSIPEISRNLSNQEDIAGLGRREDIAEVYLVRNDQGDVETLILPVRGYGLWSTMRGFLALDEDLNTVRGIGFYDHAETPGLGGEIDNPNWQSQWVGKQVYGDDNNVQLGVKKGSVDSSNDYEASHRVDGLSGATLTSNGVSRMVEFWFGEQGFKSFVQNLKAGEA